MLGFHGLDSGGVGGFLEVRDCWEEGRGNLDRWWSEAACGRLGEIGETYDDRPRAGQSLKTIPQFQT